MRYALALAGLAAAVQATTYTVTATEEVTITSCAPTHTNCPYKSHTWAEWDPESPDAKTTTKPAAGDNTWSAWDPAKPTTTPKPVDPAHTWADWDPTKPSTTSKPVDPAHTWADWDPTKPSTTGKPVDPASTWADWDPTKPSSKTSPAAASVTWTAWTDGAATPASTGASCPQYTATAPPAWFSQLPSSVLSSLAAKWTGAPPADWCYYSYSAGVVTQTKTPVAATGAAESTWAAWQGTGTPVQGVSATGTGPIAKYTGAANANAASFVLAGAAAVAAVVLA